MMKKIVIAMFLSVAAFAATGKALSVRQYPVAEGYSATSVNTAVFRGSSVVSYNGKLQFTAFYDPEGYVVAAKRELPSRESEASRKYFWS